MSRLAIALAGLSVLAVPLDATAQAVENPSRNHTPRPRPPVVYQPRLDSQLQLDRLQSEIFRQNLTRQALGQTSLSRRGRAERVAVLVDQGQCDEAQGLALDERDAEMARRVLQVCVPTR